MCKYTLLFILHFHKKITFAKNILVMIQSMTGYGKATAIFGEKKINVEIKSLNSKAMDLSTRIAPLYREKKWKSAI